MIFERRVLFYLCAVLGCCIHSTAQIHSKRTKHMERNRQLLSSKQGITNDLRKLGGGISKLDIGHLEPFNTPESPKEQIMRHKHKHDSKGSRTSYSSYSRSEDGGDGPGSISVPTPLRPGYALRGINPEDVEGAVAKEDEGKEREEAERTDVNDKVELKTVDESTFSNIINVANGKEELSEFVKASEIAGVDEILRNGESLTIFAPTNQAFAEQSDELLQNYFSGDWNKHLEDLLLSHVSNNRVLSEDLTNDMQVEMLNDDVLFVTLDPPKIDGDIGFTSFDIKGTNGVIHEIDNARLPLSTMVNTVEFLELATMLEDIPYSFSSFLEYSALANLTDAFATASPITLFVPTDEAFKNSSEGFLTYLGENLNALGKVLANHGTAGNMYSDELSGSIQTYEANLALEKNEERIRIISNSDEIKVNVVEMDVVAKNGVIHVVDSLLVPDDVLKAFNAV